jgi:hypothetical protein
MQAIQRFQQARSLAAEGDVSTIQPWMTIHYVSRIYNVPESYLYEKLNITDSRQQSHIPLRALAIRYNRSTDGFIRDIQTAIELYRKQNPHRQSLTLLQINAMLVWQRKMT